MATIAEEQASSLTPPRRGAVWALTVDSTARAYDLRTVALGGYTPEASLAKRSHVVLYLQAETNDVYFYFDTATGSSLLDTTKQAATAATLAFNDAHCAILKAGTSMAFRIDRTIDKFLQVKAASTSGVLRMWAVSESR